jgi:hypothetical protein
VFGKACIWNLSQATWIQSTSSNTISIRSILILSSSLRRSLLGGMVFLGSLQLKCCMHLWPHACYVPCPSHPLWFAHLKNMLLRVQIMKSLVVLLSTFSAHGLHEDEMLHI